jgi:hypothetical protein
MSKSTPPPIRAKQLSSEAAIDALKVKRQQAAQRKKYIIWGTYGGVGAFCVLVAIIVLISSIGPNSEKKMASLERQKEKEATKEAAPVVNRERFRAIRRAAASLETATESGVTLEKLKQSIAAFTTELKLLEGDVEGAKEKEILACYVRAKEAYEASVTLWLERDDFREHYASMYVGSDIHRKSIEGYIAYRLAGLKIVRKYNLKPESVTGTLHGYASDKNGDVLKKDSIPVEKDYEKTREFLPPDTLQTMWKIGSAEIAKAAEMLASSRRD